MKIKQNIKSKSKKNVEDLVDSYIIKLLKQKTILSRKDIPQELIELKRLQLQLIRSIR